MKVTEAEVIGVLEEELIEAVKGGLDLSAVGELIKERFIVSGLTVKKGDIVVHGGKVAYSLDLSLMVDIKILMDRSGNHIPDRTGEKEGLLGTP